MAPNVVTTIFAAKDLMSQKVMAMQNTVANAGQKAFAFGRKAAVTGLLIGAPLVVAAKQAVDFEDRMADVAKTTGMQGRELKKFGDDILEMSTKTRSSIEDITTIAEIGGRLGIAKKDLKGFTIEANKFAVALGGDFSGGVESAITEFGKLKNLFADTRDLDVSESLKKSGSAFNALSAQGVNVEGLTDFALRVGALPEVMRPSLASTSALGATLQKSGVDAQIASSGFSNFISKAAQQLPMFAKEMGLSTQEAQKLLNTDTAMFFAQFSAKMKGVPADQLAIKLKKLGLNSLEVQKAVGAMSGSMETYAKLSGISMDQMQKGTSITDEYNTKNNNTAGQLAKLRNNLKSVAITVGNALLPVVNSLVESLAPILKSVGNWMRNNKGLVTTLVKVAAVVTAVSFAISGVSFVIGAFQKAMAIGRAAMAAFNLVMGLNPAVLIAAAVVALGVAVYGLASAFNAATSAEEVNNEVRQRALEKTADQRVEMMILFSTLRKAKEGTDAYKNALDKIDKMSPGLVQKYQLQEKNLRNIALAEKDLAAQILKRAEAEVRAEMLKESVKKEMAIKEGRDKSTTRWLMETFGGPGGQLGSEALKQKEIKNEQQRQAVLSNQIAGDQLGVVQPDGTSSKNKLEITLNGAVDAIQNAMLNGKTVDPKKGPILSKTR